MPINVRPHSGTPLELGDENYGELIGRKASGWSQCDGETEWIAKLHYLRDGFRNGKLEPAQFEEREARLVINWLRKMA